MRLYFISQLIYLFVSSPLSSSFIQNSQKNSPCNRRCFIGCQTLWPTKKKDKRRSRKTLIIISANGQNRETPKTAKTWPSQRESPGRAQFKKVIMNSPRTSRLKRAWDRYFFFVPYRAVPSLRITFAARDARRRIRNKKRDMTTIPGQLHRLIAGKFNSRSARFRKVYFHASDIFPPWKFLNSARVE